MSEGAAGLTLNFANVAIIVEPVLNEALMTQAIGRINRIGQTRPTTTLKMVAEDTIEERIVQLAKRRAASERPVANAEADTLTKDELAWLFDIDVEQERQAQFRFRPAAPQLNLDDVPRLDNGNPDAPVRVGERGLQRLADAGIFGDGAPDLDMDDPFVEGEDDDGHLLLIDDHFDALAFDNLDDEHNDDSEDDSEDEGYDVENLADLPGDGGYFDRRE